MNMILGDVEETVTTVEIDEETFEEIIKARRWLMPPFAFLLLLRTASSRVLAQATGRRLQRDLLLLLAVC